MLSHTLPSFHNTMHLRVFVTVLFIFLVSLLGGCQGRNILDAGSNGPVPGSNFDTPEQLLSQLDAHGVSAAGQTKPGALYESTLLNNLVNINGTALDFMPSWDPAGSHLFSDLAYAIYLFDGTGLSGASAVNSVWATPPAGTDLWIGLADFSKDRWAWFQPGVAAPLAIADIAPYIDPAGSRILVAYVLTGTTTCSLTEVTLGEIVPELPMPVVPLTPIPMGGTGLAGPVLADGNPAYAYIEDQGGTPRLIYIRALDSDGTTWDAPVEITAGSFGIPGLAVIGGNPAVAYQTSGGVLAYRRATDAQGASWGTPIDVDALTPGAGTTAELLEIAGNPAIAYLSAGMGPNTQPAKYIRADDALGGAWSATPIVLNPEYAAGDDARYMSFAIIGSNPAVAYNWVSSAGAGTRYVRATDVNGAAWGAPIDVPGTGYVNDGSVMLRNVDLADLGGLPGIVYFIDGLGDPTNSATYFADAQDVDGTNWDLPQLILKSPPGEDPVTFGSLHVLTRQDSTKRAIIVVPRGGEFSANDYADFFVATILPAGGADFSTGTKHMIARFQFSKAPSVFRSTSCYGSIESVGVLILLALIGGEEYVQIAAGMQGYDFAAKLMGVSTTHATVPADNF